MMKYWHEAVACALDEAGVTATDEQIDAIAKDMEGAHENIGLAFHVPENPLIREVSELERKVKAARDEGDLAEAVWREAMMVATGVPERFLYRDGKRIKVWGH